MISSSKSRLSASLVSAKTPSRRFKSSQSDSSKSDALILAHNPNDIVSPFYIPTDLKILETYMKSFHQRSLLHGKGKFYLVERDYETLRVVGTSPVTFPTLNFNDYYAVVNFAKWITDLQSNSLKNNFISLEKKLDDSVETTPISGAKTNKFAGKINLHPHVSVKITPALFESLIDELTKEKLVDNLYDIESLTEFFDFLVSDRDFFVFNHEVVLQSLVTNLFVGLPDIAILEKQFEKLLDKFEEYGLDSSSEAGILEFVSHYFDQLRRINVSKEPLSDSLMSSLFNFYTNVELYDDSYAILQQMLRGNKCLPRPSHLLNYLSKINDPLKLTGLVSMFQFDGIDSKLYESILNKVDCFEKVKFITSINPDDFFGNLGNLTLVLNKLEKLNAEELDNSSLYTAYLSYYLTEFDALNRVVFDKKVDENLFRLVVRSLYSVGNFFSINQYLQAAEREGILTASLVSGLKRDLESVAVHSDRTSIEVFQGGFREIVVQKLGL